MILSGQVPKALGLPIPAGLGAIEVLQAVAQSLGSVNTAAAALAVGTSAAMLLLPTVHPKMPSALIAVGGATAASRVFGLDVATVGQLPSGWEAFGQGGQPIIMPPVEALPSLLASQHIKAVHHEPHCWLFRVPTSPSADRRDLGPQQISAALADLNSGRAACIEAGFRPPSLSLGTESRARRLTYYSSRKER